MMAADESTASNGGPMMDPTLRNALEAYQPVYISSQVTKTRP